MDDKVNEYINELRACSEKQYFGVSLTKVRQLGLRCKVYHSRASWVAQLVRHPILGFGLGGDLGL